jgi:Resolvase, N terminal domain
VAAARRRGRHPAAAPGPRRPRDCQLDADAVRSRDAPFAAAAVVQERAPALGYASVPRDRDRAEPEARAQQLAIAKACDRLGLELVDLVRDSVAEGRQSAPRPGLAYALERIDTGEASCLVVTGLGRLGGPVAELAPVLDRINDTIVTALPVTRAELEIAATPLLTRALADGVRVA